MTAAEKHIRHYNHLNGKVITKKQLVRIHTALKGDLDKKKIDIHGPLGAECITIRQRIESALKLMNGKPMRITLQLIPVDNILRTAKLQDEAQKKQRVVLAGSSSLGRSVAHRLAGLKNDNKRPGADTPKVFPAEQKGHVVHKMKFDKIELDEPYRSDFNKLYSDTQMMVWGLPSSGKSVYLMKFAKYLAEKKKLKTAYIAAEEYGRSTFDEKIEQFNIRHPNLVIVKSLEQLQREGHKLEDFRVIFFDSVNKMRWSVEDWTEFAEAHPNMLKIAIIQTTKDGDFKGGQEWQHEVDIAGEIRNRKLIVRKNRLDPEFAKKRDRLLLEDKIREKEERMKVHEKVKERIAPPAEKVLASFKPDTIV